MGRIHRSRFESFEKRKKLILRLIISVSAIIFLTATITIFMKSLNASVFNANYVEYGKVGIVKKIAQNDTDENMRDIDEEFGVDGTDNTVKTDCKSSSISIEQSSKKIISGVNYDVKLPMASTTKVVTALLACKSGKLQDIVTIPAAACGIEGSSIYLTPNEKIKLEDLVYGLMLRSGNDSAVAIALYLGGSIEGFASMMNDYAKSVGAVNSNFVNPHGLHDPNHYTTAYDLAVITADALDDANFSKIVSTKMHAVESEGKETRYLANKNKMLTMYKGAIGVKTGYTKAAGRCLVSAAEKDGIKIVSVVLNEPDMWAKSVANLDEGFNRTKRVTLVESNKELFKFKLNKSDKIIGVCAKNNINEICIDKVEDICYNFDIDKNLKKKIAINDRVGELQLIRNGNIFAKVELYAMSIDNNISK